MWWKVMEIWLDLRSQTSGRRLKTILKRPDPYCLKPGMLPSVAGLLTARLLVSSASYIYTTKDMLKLQPNLQKWTENTVCFRVFSGTTILGRPMKITRKVFLKFNVKILGVPINFLLCLVTPKQLVTPEGKMVMRNYTAGRIGPTGRFNHVVYQTFNIKMKQEFRTLIPVLR